MKSIGHSLLALLICLFTGVLPLYSQLDPTVPAGIHYQAVARGSDGKELVSTTISVKFAILANSEAGTVVYEEVHSNVVTSKYGVFSRVIGQGTNTGAGTATNLSEIEWSTGKYFLKVYVRFENDFMDMGTMQFLAVPYALYAAKSLEPGPQGPAGPQGAQGEPGNPATDDQTLSFDGSSLKIADGNTVDLTSLLQSLTVTNAADGYYLGLTRGNSVKLATIEADGDITNEIQDLTINADKLKITKNSAATEWDLSVYRDNTDAQALTYDPANRILSISGNASTVNLTELENDADANPTNEIQTLTYNEGTKSLSISGTGGNSVTLGSLVAFRAQKTLSTAASASTDVTFVGSVTTYNDGAGYNTGTGEFTAPATGIYTFVFSYFADGSGGSRELKLFLNSSLYEYFAVEVGSYSTVPARSITMKLTAGDIVKVVIFTGTATQTGTGTFSGFKVN